MYAHYDVKVHTRKKIGLSLYLSSRSHVLNAEMTPPRIHIIIAIYDIHLSLVSQMQMFIDDTRSIMYTEIESSIDGLDISAIKTHIRCMGRVCCEKTINIRVHMSHFINKRVGEFVVNKNVNSHSRKNYKECVQQHDKQNYT